MRLEIRRDHPEPRKIQRAVELLRDAAVIAYPTDTAYAIGCDMMQKRAVDRLYAVKRMRPEQPLALICPDLGDLARYAVVDDRTYRLMRRLTPGPYCFVLQASREVPRMLQMKRKTVGIRVPHDEVCLALVRALGNPLVTTTASKDGQILSDPADIDAAFPGLDLVLDAGSGGVVPSTVLDVSGPEIVVVREGAGPLDLL